MDTKEPSEGAVQSAVNKIVSLGVEGVGPFKGARQICDEHLNYGRTNDVAITRVIATHSRIVTASGFATGLGGAVLLPVTIPTDLTVFYALSARCAAAVAHLRGYDIDSDEVRSVVLLSLLGAGGAAVLADVGIKAGNRAAMAALNKVPGRVLIEINKKVGFRLLTKAGEKGAVNLIKLVPLAGGVVGGGVNLAAMRGVGKYSRINFPHLGV